MAQLELPIYYLRGEAGQPGRLRLDDGRPLAVLPLYSNAETAEVAAELNGLRAERLDRPADLAGVLRDALGQGFAWSMISVKGREQELARTEELLRSIERTTAKGQGG